jgi:hypothetical protein
LVVCLGHETVATNRFTTFHTSEAFLMPLMVVPFKFLHASLEDFVALVAFSTELFIITVVTEQSIVSRPEKLVYQRVLAFGTFETTFMPMLIFVRQIL